jgi:hypothetical protein
MKTIKKQLLIISFLLAFKAQAHVGVSAGIEQLWGQKGIVSHLLKQRDARNIKQTVFEAYLSKSIANIKRDRAIYFNFKDSDLDYASLWLDSINALYSEALIEFNDTFTSDVNTSVNSSSSMFTTTICDNIDFESNSVANWTLKQGIACPGEGCNAFATYSGPTPSNDITSHVSLMSSGYDPNIIGSIIPMVRPGGSYSLKLENNTFGGDAMMLTRTISIDASKPFYKYSFAAVLEDPGSSHSDNEKPYFSIVLKDPSGNVIPCSKYKVVANPASAEIKENFVYDNSSGLDLYYRNWTDVIIPLDEYIGQNVTVEFVISDCSWGGHMAYVYLDGDCFNPSITVDSCVSLSEPKRKLSVSDEFILYSWTGPDVLGDNSQNQVWVGSAGNYKVRLASRGGCSGHRDISVVSCSTSVTPCTLSIDNLQASTCDANSNTFSVSGEIDLSSSYLNSGMIIVSVGSYSQIFHAPFTSGFTFNFDNLMSGTGSWDVVVKYYKDLFSSSPVCETTAGVMAPSSCVFIPIICENCIGSFKPIEGKTYIISAWVKEEGADLSTVITYSNPYIEISFNGGATVLAPVYASGLIIEGWQRIYYEFTIPSGTTEISIALKTMNGIASFDDIRVHPIDAGFTSYVYDPISLKLVAVLDDNNYATFYEYDQEGTLIRTKKETIRGVVTITESRENNPKR